ncbi:MAG: hypothetical protein AB1679_33345 [Actinomycetota bacterium]
MSEEAGRLDVIRNRIRSHPGYIEYMNCLAFEQTIAGVFSPNLRELVELLERAARDEGLAIELIQNVRRPDIRERFQAALTRALHNYVASAMTLVDHARRLMRGRSGPVVDEFQQLKLAVVERGEVQFVHGLRNFMLHRTVPLIGHRLSFAHVNTPQQTMRSEVSLSVSQLLEWDRWPGPAKDFLAEQADDLELRPVIRLHGDLTYKLNVWLHTALVAANGPALEDVNRLVEEANAALMGCDIETARQRTAEWTERRSRP